MINQVSIVILPLPAQGHLNQLLHLALRLSSRSIPVHYVGSSTHNRQARDRSLGPTLTSDFLHFHDFQLPPYDCPPPDTNSSTNFPSHLQPSFFASLHLLSPLRSLLLFLSTKYIRVVLIHDSAMSFSTSVASTISNVEPYAFHSVSAYSILSFIKNIGFEDCFTDEFSDFIRNQHKSIVNDHGRLLNTCRFLEKHSIANLESDPGWKEQKVFCIGPLNPIKLYKTKAQERRHECLAWLDGQPANSVLYVSFGTTTTLSENQIMELGKGIETSGKRFLWVLREADRGDIYADHHKKVYDTEMSNYCDKGMIYRGWAPQLEILGHESTGAFLSHCGWNSCMESMSMGVPMLAWPMHSDQPSNARLITEVLGVGVGVKEWERRNEAMGGDEIKEKILRLMSDDDDEGKEIAEKARKIGERIRDCGMNSQEFDSFVAYVTR